MNVDAVVIGGSAGAVDALARILPAQPRDLPFPIVIVLHVVPGKASHLVDLFGATCALAVKEADDKEALRPGTIYFAPPSYHLLVERGRHLSLSVDAPVHFSRPSIDVLFDSAADAYGDGLVGLLLSGANEDGAAGLAKIKDAGGTTIVQSPETSQVATMPVAAIAMRAIDHVLSPGEIGAFIAELGARATKKVEAR